MARTIRIASSSALTVARAGGALDRWAGTGLHLGTRGRNDLPHPPTDHRARR